MARKVSDPGQEQIDASEVQEVDMRSSNYEDDGEGMAIASAQMENDIELNDDQTLNI